MHLAFSDPSTRRHNQCYFITTNTRWWRRILPSAAKAWRTLRGRKMYRGGHEFVCVYELRGVAVAEKMADPARLSSRLKGLSNDRLSKCSHTIKALYNWKQRRATPLCILNPFTHLQKNSKKVQFQKKWAKRGLSSFGPSFCVLNSNFF